MNRTPSLAGHFKIFILITALIAVWFPASQVQAQTNPPMPSIGARHPQYSEYTFFGPSLGWGRMSGDYRKETINTGRRNPHGMIPVPSVPQQHQAIAVPGSMGGYSTRTSENTLRPNSSGGMIFASYRSSSGMAFPINGTTMYKLENPQFGSSTPLLHTNHFFVNNLERIGSCSYDRHCVGGHTPSTRMAQDGGRYVTHEETWEYITTGFISCGTKCGWPVIGSDAELTDPVTIPDTDDTVSWVGPGQPIPGDGSGPPVICDGAMCFNNNSNGAFQIRIVDGRANLFNTQTGTFTDISLIPRYSNIEYRTTLHADTYFYAAGHNIDNQVWADRGRLYCDGSRCGSLPDPQPLAFRGNLAISSNSSNYSQCGSLVQLGCAYLINNLGGAGNYGSPIDLRRTDARTFLNFTSASAPGERMVIGMTITEHTYREAVDYCHRYRMITLPDGTLVEDLDDCIVVRHRLGPTRTAGYNYGPELQRVVVGSVGQQ